MLDNMTFWTSSKPQIETLQTPYQYTRAFIQRDHARPATKQLMLLHCQSIPKNT
jgi:hypothetical protein